MDVYGLIMDDEFCDEAETAFAAPDEALVECLNRYGTVDFDFLLRATGMSAESLANELQGVIFQDPEKQRATGHYDISVGWEISESYLNGNVRRKLEKAKKANELFPHRFDSNIEALKKILPPTLTIDDIHISLGAVWVPAEEYVDFITEFLHFSQRPELSFSRDLGRWDLRCDEESKKSVFNTITYGVRGTVGDGTPSGYMKQYLTALDIIVQTLNAKTVKVYDYIPTYNSRTGNYDYEPVLNKDMTVEAQDKQKEICDAFKDFVYADALRTERFESYYNEALVGYTFSAYDGSFLRLPGLNPEVKLFDHQKNAVARVLLSGKNVLLAHDVGTGKTYEMVVSVHELKRMGLSAKNLVVVPNNVLKATENAHRLLYPNDKILVIYPKDFTPQKRNSALCEIRDGDYTAIYMAYSSFDMIVMSKSYYIGKRSAEIKRLKRAHNACNDKRERREYRHKISALEEKLAKYIVDTPECEYLTFDELFVNTLVVDEAHNYKNIPIITKSDNIVGIRRNSSKKCTEMIEKAHFVDRLIFATGTPLTNSLADLFTFQTYLQPNTLKMHGIETFDTWVNTFGQRETGVECDVDANSKNLRTVTRFSSFHNLSELMGMFAQVCDFHKMDEDDEDLPEFSGHEDICIKRSEAQAECIEELSKRTDDIRMKKVKRHEDNLLMVTTTGRLLAVDIRLIHPDAVVPDGEMTKIRACALEILRIYRQYDGMTQVVFSDVGTPKEAFNVYDCLKENLEKLGIPSHEIAFVHDATSESARAKLFEKMNSGELRVVIGSTLKLGVGVNVQERLVALHHLSVPWKPADMVQREGRILRKGNTSERIFMYRYITEGSFDAYSWQLLENKQKFISSFLSGTSSVRETEDIADTVLSYAEVKALAIGNPLIKKRVEVSNLLQRERIASRLRQKQMQELRTVIETMPEKIADTTGKARLAQHDSAWFRSEKRTVSIEERLSFGEELLLAVSDNVLAEEERVFDTYRGFTVVLPSIMTADNQYVLIRSPLGGEYVCQMNEDKTPLGCCKTIDYLLDRLSDRAEKLFEQAEIYRRRLKDAAEDLDRENPHIAQIENLKKKLHDIDIMLENGIKEEKAS